MTFPTEWKNNPNVPNHQPNMDDRMITRGREHDLGSLHMFTMKNIGLENANLLTQFSGIYQ